MGVYLLFLPVEEGNVKLVRQTQCTDIVARYSSQGTGVPSLGAIGGGHRGRLLLGLEADCSAGRETCCTGRAEVIRCEPTVGSGRNLVFT